jgi:peptidoglycan/LPS O-acetylase OafA/YrhL
MKTLFRQFSRVTSGGVYIPEIDALRFVAIMGVLLYHLNGFVWMTEFPIFDDRGFLITLAVSGFRGVPLFFVISGFILALPFASHYLKDSKKVNLKNYFLRRLTRLEPPYIAVVCFCFFLFIIKNGWGEASSLVPNFIAHLFYLHNIIFEGMGRIIPVAWSLEVEIQFYILVPALVLIFKIPGILRTLLLAGLILLLSWVNASTHYQIESVFKYIPFFLSGFLLADIYLTYPPKRKSIFCDIFILGGYYYLRSLGWHLFDVIFPLSICVLYYAFFSSVILKYLLCSYIPRTIGTMCYTIYLLHLPIMHVIINWIRPYIEREDEYVNAMIYSGLISISVIVFLSAIFFIFLEKPCMNKEWPRQLYRFILRKKVSE